MLLFRGLPFRFLQLLAFPWFFALGTSTVDKGSLKAGETLCPIKYFGHFLARPSKRLDCGTRCCFSDAGDRRKEYLYLKGRLGFMKIAVENGHGERSRVQLLLKLTGTVTAVLDLWLGNFGWANVVVPVYVRVLWVLFSALVTETRSPCVSRSASRS